jgi:hypothetical protein
VVCGHLCTILRISCQNKDYPEIRGLNMIDTPSALQSRNSRDRIPIDFFLLLFLVGKKSNKRTQPGDAENSPPLPISVARAKTRWMQRLAWVRGFDMVYSSRQCIDLDPLKQFAPVIHGNRKGQGRIAMGKTLRRTRLFIRQRDIHTRLSLPGKNSISYGCQCSGFVQSFPDARTLFFFHYTRVNCRYLIR